MPRIHPKTTDEAIQDHINLRIAVGFDPIESIVESTIEMHEDDRPEDELRPIVEAMAAEALGAHLEVQDKWPEVTDCDRLDRAFAALEARGIVARQNFSCCSTCGVAEIGDEIAEAECRGDRVRGYAFYHAQDADGAVDGGGLYLNYDSIEESEAPALEVGRVIVATLKEHGLETDWDGAWNRRIWVGVDWKRRR